MKSACRFLAIIAVAVAAISYATRHIDNAIYLMLSALWLNAVAEWEWTS